MSEPIQSMDLSNSGKAYVASCTNNRMYLIEKKSGNKIIQYSGHNCENYKIDCIFNKRDSQILTGSIDGKLYVYDIMRKQPVKVFEICDKPISSIDVHENAGYLTAGHDGNITYWKC